MAINFNDYLKMTGLGESAPVTRRKRKNVKPGKFNPIAFAEAYSYAIQDGRRMRLSGIANQREGSRIAARGEAGLEDAKQFIKDKSKQAWEFLKKLYEKVIRFFTETLRYLMSNERKIGKAIAKLKAAKKTNKDELKVNIPVYTELINTGESYYGFGEDDLNKKNKNDQAEAKKALRNAYSNQKENENLKRENKELKGQVASFRDQVKMLQNELYAFKEALVRKTSSARAKAEAADKKGKEVAEAVVSSPATTDSSASSPAVSGGSGGDNPSGGNGGGALPPAVIEKAQEGAKEAKEAMNEIAKVTDGVTKYQGRYFLIFGNLLVDAYTAADARLDCASGFETLVEGNDAISDTINEFKEITGALFKEANEGNGTVEGSRADYIAYVDTFIEGLQKIKDAKSMFRIQKTVRELQKEKAALDKARKKSSHQDKMDDGKTLAYQLRRGALQGKIKLANLYIGVTDKAIGKILSVGGKIAAAA